MYVKWVKRLFLMEGCTVHFLQYSLFYHASNSTFHFYIIYTLQDLRRVCLYCMYLYLYIVYTDVLYHLLGFNSIHLSTPLSTIIRVHVIRNVLLLLQRSIAPTAKNNNMYIYSRKILTYLSTSAPFPLEYSSVFLLIFGFREYFLVRCMYKVYNILCTYSSVLQ